jgi:hypothetical protein
VPFCTTSSRSALPADLSSCQVLRAFSSQVLADGNRSSLSPQSRCSLVMAGSWVRPRRTLGPKHSMQCRPGQARHLNLRVAGAALRLALLVRAWLGKETAYQRPAHPNRVGQCQSSVSIHQDADDAVCSTAWRAEGPFCLRMLQPSLWPWRHTSRRCASALGHRCPGESDDSGGGELLARCHRPSRPEWWPRA